MLSRRIRSLAILALPPVVLAIVFLYVNLIFPGRSASGDAQLGYSVVSVLKAVLAMTALGLSLYTAFRRLAGRPVPRRAQVGVAAVLGAFSIGAYLNFGNPGTVEGYHSWEFFHYYLGAKYHHELGYDGLYAATAVAEAELSPAFEADVKRRSLRNLQTNIVEPATTALARSTELKARFDAPRWEAFKRDISWFRNAGDSSWWNAMQMDHGFNGPPVWLLAGHALASLRPPSDGFFRILASIDFVLFTLLFTAIGWAFGFRVLCSALVLWGTQLPFNNGFTYGAFLRQDWIFLLVASACLAKKRWFMLAGAALAYAALLRLFPGLFFVPIFGVAVVRGVREKRLPRSLARFFAGAALATALLGAASVATVGVRGYSAFAARISTHGQGASPNLMGLKTIVAFATAERLEITTDRGARDETARWGALREERLDRRGPFLAFCVVVAFALVAWALQRRLALWMCFPLGLPLVVCATELANYYYAVFLLLPLAGRFARRFEFLTLGTATASALLGAWPWTSSFGDVRFYCQSWVFLLAGSLVAAGIGAHEVRARTRARRSKPSMASTGVDSLPRPIAVASAAGVATLPELEEPVRGRDDQGGAVRTTRSSDSSRGIAV